MPQMYMDHDIDPKQEIYEKAGDIKNVEVYFNRVLVGLYLRPAKMKKIVREDGSTFSLQLTDETRGEDKFQGRVGLVLKKGPRAFIDDGQANFYGQSVEVGDWVVFRPSNGDKLDVNKARCVLLGDTMVEMKIPEPDMVF